MQTTHHYKRSTILSGGTVPIAIIILQRLTPELLSIVEVVWTVQHLTLVLTLKLNGDTLLVVDRPMLDSLVDIHIDLTKVCVSNITDMKDALRKLRWFDQDISAWDVSNVTDMKQYIHKARIFNQDIGNWDVSSVSGMSRMFQAAVAFNQDIGGWDVSNVQRFRAMFRNADAFNQDIGGWDVSKVANDLQMSDMFRSADNFSQDLSMWCVSNVASKPSGFDANSQLTSSQLPQWELVLYRQQ